MWIRPKKFQEGDGVSWTWAEPRLTWSREIREAKMTGMGADSRDSWLLGQVHSTKSRPMKFQGWSEGVGLQPEGMGRGWQDWDVGRLQSLGCQAGFTIFRADPESSRKQMEWIRPGQIPDSPQPEGIGGPRLLCRQTLDQTSSLYHLFLTWSFNLINMYCLVQFSLISPNVSLL